MLALLAAVLGAFAIWKYHSIQVGMKLMQSSYSPPTVSTVKAGMQDWQPNLNSIGTLRAVNGADLSSEVSGIVSTLSFDSGKDVERNTVLVQLRAADDIAKLKSLEASAKLAQLTLDRDMKQLKAEAISKAAVDNDVATLKSAKAQVEAQQATIEKKIIRAPFAGHLGIRQVDLGQFLNPGATIVTLQQLNPIYVDFTLPEQALSSLHVGQKVALKTDAVDGEAFTGKITALNSKIDDATRNISVRATLKNSEHKLLPGMFAHVAIDAGQIAHHITLPQTAIVFNTYGNTVFLVEHKTDNDATKPELSVQQRVVITGETRGDQVAVLSGIKEGDEIVSSGQVKLRNGMGINISNDNQPANDPNPKPHEQ
jgi:membrane fusion protein (multidrug efflux system)